MADGAGPHRVEVRRDDELDCDVVVLEHDDGNPAHHVVAEVAPALGSNLYRFDVGGTQLLRGDRTLLRHGRWSGTLVLWPLPNRVRDKRYRFGGRTVDLSDVVRPEGNEPLIHGLVDDRAWEHDEPHAGGDGSTVRTWVETHPGSPHFAHHPFPSRLSLELTVHAGGVRVAYTVDNLGGEPMPCAFALHPHFEVLDGAESVVVVPADGTMEADDELLPTGAVLPMGSQGFDLRRPTALFDVELDDVFTQLHRGEPPRLRFPLSGLELAARASADFTHVVLYTLKARDQGFVCLENQTGSTDAINLYARALEAGDEALREAAHLLVIPPGGRHQGWISYEVSRLVQPV